MVFLLPRRFLSGSMNDEDTALAKRLGRALKQLRKELHWTQARLAEAVEMSVNHVGYLERGERLPSVPMLVKLARVLGTNTGELLGEQLPRAPRNARAHALLAALPEEQLAAAIAMLNGLLQKDVPAATLPSRAAPRPPPPHPAPPEPPRRKRPNPRGVAG